MESKPVKVFKIHEHLRAKVKVGCESFAVSLSISFDPRLPPTFL